MCPEKTLLSPYPVNWNRYLLYGMHHPLNGFPRSSGSTCCTRGEAGETGNGMVNCSDHAVWGLFLQPGYEGIGRKLQDKMPGWYSAACCPIRPDTAPGIRTEQFTGKPDGRKTGICSMVKYGLSCRLSYAKTRQSGRGRLNIVGHCFKE